MKLLLLTLLVGACATDDTSSGGDPHAQTTEGCLPGRTCDLACSSKTDRPFIGGTCIAADGFSCPESFYVFGNEIRGCCEPTSTTVVFHECEQ